MRSAPSAGALREVLQDYLAFYRANWAEGKLRLCDEAPLKSRAGRLRVSDAGKWDAGTIAESCWMMRGQREAGTVFQELSQAFGYLELLCVNLFLSPWRKEIKSLKTFTGNFVYYIKSVLPESVIEQLLSEIGYVATTATEYSLVRKLNAEEAEHTAFEIFLARIECEDLLEIAGDMKDSNLADILQKRAQKHCLPCVDLDKKQEISQRKDYVITGESNGTPNPGMAYLSHSQRAFNEQEKMEHGNDIGLRCTATETRPAASKQIPDQDMNQNQTGETSTHSCIKSMDSEDFLIKYSDIVIGQKPLHFSTPSSRATREETWLTETRLGLPASGAESLTLLPSDESGPQALAILSDSTVVNKTPYDYQVQDSCQKTIESKICIAMKCLSLHGSDTIDRPKELKGSMVHQPSKSSSDLALMLDKQPRNKEDCVERLMYPVEETAHPESARSQRVTEELYHPGMKFADLPHRESYNMDLYSSDHFSNITGCKYPTPGPSYGRHLEVVPIVREAEGYLKHVGEPPISTCPIPSEAQYCGDIPACIQCRQEGCPLHSSLADLDTRAVHMSEPSLDSYVVINKDN
ncbi:uncharacterized protein LOC134504039 [Candoia aspera]|uniref:uncharacterized protein LOC134504039 n=1 Tax=Candoia aspera TaxID=51853 RepID=UPI002FD858FF